MGERRYRNTWFQWLAGVLLAVAAAGPALAQCYSQELLPPVLSERTKFGSSLALHRGGLLVGDFRARGTCPGMPPGTCILGGVTAWTFDASAGGWVVEAEIRADAPGGSGNFGVDVAVESDRMIVGATRASVAGDQTGAAFVFDFDGERWTQSGVIEPSEPNYPSAFGGQVEVEGSLAVVSDYPVVYVFEETGAGWTNRQRITAPDASMGGGEYFGATMELVNGWLFVGALLDGLAGDRVGAVYVFRRTGVEFEFIEKLYPPDPGLAAFFGNALASDGRTLLVGAYGTERAFIGQGAVYEFALADDRWQYVDDFTSEQPQEGDSFGAAVAYRDGRAVVGMTGREGPTTSGWATYFERDGRGRWAQVADLRPLLGPTGHYGGPVAMGDRWAFVTARTQQTGYVETGAVHAFDLDEAACNCPVDLDGDGETTVFDFFTFANLFQAGDLRADFDGDGALTVIDFLVFQIDFVRGC
ncbi:MAG: GC-type dockerin domain-anchored protein [Phycisphaerales bacterium]|jgi:hypothetical protein